MKIKATWKNCSLFDGNTAYFIEISRTQIDLEILNTLSKKDKDQLKDPYYQEKVNDWVEANPDLALKDHVYLLISETGKESKLEEASFIYGGMWNAYSPLDAMEIEIKNLSDLPTLSIKAAIKEYLSARQNILRVGNLFPELIGGNDNMIGRIGEYVALDFLKSIGQNPVKVLHKSNQGYDLTDGDIKTQVKCITSENDKGKSVRLKKPWNQLILIELNNDYVPEIIGIITEQEHTVALKDNPIYSETPIVKLSMLSKKGLIGKYGKIYYKDQIDI